MPSYTSDPDYTERAKLAADPAVDARARALILDPGVKISDARELAATAKRIAAGYAKAGGFGARLEALDPTNQAQAMSLTANSAHIVNGGVTWDGVRQVFGAPVVVRN